MSKAVCTCAVLSWAAWTCERLKAGGELPIWRHFCPKIKFREKTFPRLRQAGESFSLNLISSQNAGKCWILLRSAAVAEDNG